MPDSSPSLAAPSESVIATPWMSPLPDRKVAEGAALWESLSQNHPFVDGDKRIAVTVTAAFLKVNGFRLEFDDLEAHRFLMQLYESGRMRFSDLDAWLRSHAVAVPTKQF